MADDKKEATNKEKKKDAKEAPAATGTPAAKAGGGMPLGAIVAGVVLLALGGGLGVGGSMVVAKFAGGTTAEAKVAEGGETASAAKTTEGEHGISGKKSLNGMTEVSIGDLMSNIRNQQGRRFVKVSCAVYIVTADAIKMGLAGAKGGEAGANIKRIMQQALEEHLKNYDMDELTGANVYGLLNKGFRDALDRALSDAFPEEAGERRLVERVVLTNLLVQ